MLLASQGALVLLLCVFCLNLVEINAAVMANEHQVCFPIVTLLRGHVIIVITIIAMSPPP